MSRRSRILDGPQGQRVQRAISAALADVAMGPGPIVPAPRPGEDLQCLPARGVLRDRPERPYCELLEDLAQSDVSRQPQPARFAGAA